MTRTSPYASPTDLPSHYVPVGTSLHSPGRQVPLRRISSSSSSTGSERRRSSSRSSPSFNELKADPRAWDELFPLPASSSRTDQWRAYRRTASFFVVVLFIVAVVGTAVLGSDGKSAVGKLPSGGFGAAQAAAAGSAAGSVAPSAASDNPRIEDDDDESAPTAQSAEESMSFADDHSHYHLLETLSAEQIQDRRIFFVGDIHGSFKQLGKLLAKIEYNADKDIFISVGDLVAKGPKPLEVLQQMRTLGVRAVRGNHDQPVSPAFSVLSTHRRADDERR